MAQKNVYRTELTPVSFLERSAYVFPDKVAVIHGDRRYTYRQLEERVNRLASALRAAGLGKHDRVAFLCPNIPAMLEAHYGVPGAGGILVAINTRLSADEIGYILDHSGASFLFVDAELAELDRAARPPRRPRRARRRHRRAGRSLRGLPRQRRAGARRELARGRGGDDRDQLHLGHDGPPEGRDVHPPRRLPERPRRADRDRA